MYRSYSLSNRCLSLHVRSVSLVILLFLTHHIIHINANPTRTITIVNECPVDYWFQSTSGAAPTVSGSSTCNQNSDCIAGSQCAHAGSQSNCYWQRPSLSSHLYRLTAHGGRNILSFPSYDNHQNIAWSGNLGFCRKGTCGTFTEQYCDTHGVRKQT